MNSTTASEKDTVFMTDALGLARSALEEGEFPVGCVIAGGGTVVARGHRTGTAAGPPNEVDHAEINALRHLSGDIRETDRSGLSIYCTMEPCLMCFSAIMLNGINRIVYAYEDVMGGGTTCDRSGLSPLYRDAQLTVISGVMRADSLLLFQRFFADSSNRYLADSRLSRYTLDQPVHQ